MFRRANGRAKLQPKTGDSVRIRARVTLYEGRGEFQLVCEHIEAAGVGALQVAFEQLKARLSEEGLFASEHKQSIPTDAEHVGIVTFCYRRRLAGYSHDTRATQPPYSSLCLSGSRARRWRCTTHRRCD
jgi:hypothetical protein